MPRARCRELVFAQCTREWGTPASCRAVEGGLGAARV